MDDAGHLKERLEPVLSQGGFIPGSDAGDRYRKEWGGVAGDPAAVIRPRSTEELSAAMRVLHAMNQPVAIQGGMTGLVHGGLPQRGEVVVSLERMNAIEAIDEDQGTALVQAGTPLQVLQEAAEARGLFFPVDLGARGTATIGGMIGTNAGGNRVLRYGMTRSSILGLEVVLADGTVVSRLNGLMKDNAGYDLKHLFIGAEGTLGIVTRIRALLQPLPTSWETAMVIVRSFSDVKRLLRHCRSALGPALSSFEVMWPSYHRLVTRDMGVGRRPFADDDGLIVLLEAVGFGKQDLREALEETLAAFIETAERADAVLAQSRADAKAFWSIRDASGEAGRAIGPSTGFDVSLPIAVMEGWVGDVTRKLAERGVRASPVFGHLGDGNLHLIAALDPADPAMLHDVHEIVHRSVGALGGSISAEHGVGMAKRAHLPLCRSEAEIAVMRRVKRALDPDGLLSPGRVFTMD